jgi:hypothetical protein
VLTIECYGRGLYLTQLRVVIAWMRVEGRIVPGTIIKLAGVRMCTPRTFRSVVPCAGREVDDLSASPRVAEIIIDCHIHQGCQNKREEE